MFEQAYGNVKNSNDFGMNELEINYRKFARRNVISARNIEIGEVVSIDDFDFKRSSLQGSIFDVNQVIGKLQHA